ncbi:YqiJ family protein [Sphingomonas quercus]|uniref:YqiJ family protein n=1 Tax=Sphingomonas quercus TaxID=2842451 RepID=A0ABS6BHQ7_9SPHN|nr:YqiJ family protein [Sphingomonas quercus]MBU3077835.1 YqiJ family protein [Sphingomonas quercus]
MLELLTAPEGAIFTAALVLMFAIGAIEALGLGASGLGVHLGLDADHDGLLGSLGVGRVPLLILLTAFLATFGAIGMVGQQFAAIFTGAFLSPVIAVPGALVAAVPLTVLVARVLARVLPRDETTAIGVDELVGLTGTVMIGKAVTGSPARARVVDRHGQAHHVLAEPDIEGSSFEEGDVILLVRRDGHQFRAILHDRPRYSDWSIS